MKRNWIGGAWVEGATAKPDVNPSDLSDSSNLGSFNRTVCM